MTTRRQQPSSLSLSLVSPRLLEVGLIGGGPIEIRETFEFRCSDPAGHEENESIEVQFIAGDVQFEIEQIDRWFAGQGHVQRGLISEQLHGELLQIGNVFQEKQQTVEGTQRNVQVRQLIVVAGDICLGNELQIVVVVHFDRDRLQRADRRRAEEMVLQTTFVSGVVGRRRGTLNPNAQETNGHRSQLGKDKIQFIDRRIDQHETFETRKTMEIQIDPKHLLDRVLKRHLLSLCDGEVLLLLSPDY